MIKLSFDLFKKEKCSTCDGVFRRIELVDVGEESFCSFICFKEYMDRLTIVEMIDFVEKDNKK